MTRLVKYLLILSFVALGYGKTFTQCELLNELKRQGFPDNQLKDWVCLIEAESSRQTHVRGGPNQDGSYDYGLFQINDRYWCSPDDKPGKSCNVRCKDLLTDDISQASTCTKKIYGIHGFSAWYGWVNKCKGKNLPDIHC